MTITYRSIKGSALTAAEIDANFYDLDQRITALEGDIPAAVEIDDFIAENGTIRMELTNATSFGPFPLLPATIDAAGAWQPATLYAKGTVLRSSGAVYFVNVPHTSAATFDPAATSGSGTDEEDIYVLLCYDATPYWQVIEAEDGAGSNIIRPAIGQAWGYFRCHETVSGEFELPHHSTAPYEIGTELRIVQRGSATINVYGASGVTVYGHADSDYSTSGVGTMVMAKKIAENQWDLVGETGTI